ncbi:La-related protein 6 [Hordeum vulgare]|nr:La-related protein 6 [Hordeum vulgare]
MASPANVGELTVVCPNLSIPEQHLTTEANKDIDYVGMSKASRQWASVLMYFQKAGYDIKLIDNNAFMWAMSHVKWSIPNPSSSTVVDLFKGPAADLLHHAVNDCDPCAPSSPSCQF